MPSDDLGSPHTVPAVLADHLARCVAGFLRGQQYEEGAELRGLARATVRRVGAELRNLFWRLASRYL